MENGDKMGESSFVDDNFAHVFVCCKPFMLSLAGARKNFVSSCTLFIPPENIRKPKMF